MSSSLESTESVCSVQRGSVLRVPVPWGQSLARGPFLSDQLGTDHSNQKGQDRGPFGAQKVVQQGLALLWKVRTLKEGDCPLPLLPHVWM